jgi:hypothetical protein
MKILIITQSSIGGLNHSIGESIKEVTSNENNDVIVIECDPTKITNESVLSSTHIIMVVPEWNGSFPYTFKQLIDNSGWPSSLKEKPIMLIGTSQTSFGNITGIAHLQQILQFCGSKIYHRLLCIPNLKCPEKKDIVRVLDNVKIFLK